MRYLKITVLSSAFFLILILYFINDSNKSLVGVIFDSFWINFLTVLYILLIHHSINIRLPEKYYAIKEYERSGKFYGLSGVRVFKVLLTKNLLPVFTAKISIKSHSILALQKLEKEMRDIETVHFLGFLSTSILMLPFGCYRDYRFFYFMIAFNIIENLYPVFVQRFNRNRINNIINKTQEKTFK